MYLSRLSTFNLSIEPSVDVLQGYTAEEKKNISSVAIKGLKRKETLVQVLSNTDSAVWMIQSVGQAFSLSWDNDDTISVIVNAITVYFQWLTSGQMDDFVFYANKIFLQLSIIFKFNGEDDVLLEWEKSCLFILNEIYLWSARKYMTMLDSETKCNWVKIMLGVTDEVLERSLSENVSINCMRVMLEMWCLANIEDDTIWTRLQEMFSQNLWLNNPNVIIQWQALCIGLTDKLMRLKSQDTESSITIHFYTDFLKKDLEECIVYISDDILFETWKRFSNILGDINLITNEKAHALAFQGIQSMVNIFYSTKYLRTADRTSAEPPDGNLIIRLFGDIIFPAILERKRGYEEGASHAFTALCTIITESSQEFEKKNLATFYYCCKKVLRDSEVNKMSQNLIQSLRYIFTKDLQGSSILIPYFFNVFIHIWEEEGTKSVAGTCVADMLLSLVCFPNSFNEVRFSKQSKKELSFKNIGLNSLGSYKKLFFLISHVLQSALTYGVQGSSVQKILWCFCIFSSEAPSGPVHVENCSNIIQIILAKIKQNIWNTSIACTALDVLSSMIIISPEVSSSPIISKLLITSLIDIIQFKMVKEGDFDSEDFNMTLKALLFCLTDWIVKTKYSLKHNELKTMLGLLKKLDKIKDPILASSARFCLLYSLSQDHHLSYSAGMCPISEADVIKAYDIPADEIQNYMHNVIHGRAILTFINIPNTEERSSIIIVRDELGRHCYRSKFNYFDDRETSSVIDTDTIDADFSFDIFSWMFTSNDTGPVDKEISNFIEYETEYLKEHNYGYNKKSKYGIKSGSSHSTLSSRILLSQLGLLDSKKSKLLPYSNDLSNIMKSLDDLNPRECIDCSIVYVRKGTTKNETIYSDNACSRKFVQFLELIGKNIDLKKHRGYKGKKYEKQNLRIKNAVYWEDYSTEIIFLVSTLIGNKFKKNKKGQTTTSQYKKNMIMKNPVVIFWYDDLDDYEEDIFESTSSIYIIITPMKNGLYRIWCTKDADGYMTYLPERMVLRFGLLGVIVRQFSLLGSRLSSGKFFPGQRPTPLSERTASISKIDSNVPEQSPTDFYHSFFGIEKAENK